MTDTLLVTGASGNLGRRVIAHLLETQEVQASQIIATTRKPEALADLAARGMVVRSADFDNAASLVSAFAGAQRMLLISTDEVASPGRRIQQHKNALDAAVKAGVQHVVYTSMLKPEPVSPVPFAPDHYATEQALAASPMSWTVLRNGLYMDLLCMSLPQILAGGKWFTAASEGKVSYVSREDCARTAAAVLASGATTKAIYDITGSAALSTTEVARVASGVFDKPVQVIQVSPEELAQGMSAAGVPSVMVPILVSFDENAKAGNVSLVSDAVKQLTGSAPQGLREFLMANRAVITG